MIVVVMGVAGAGKTTVGELLARRLGVEFLDADAFHSAANVAKMAAGTPLTDADRASWLAALHDALLERAARGAGVVLACSALKDSYRRVLDAQLDVRFVFLRISPETARARLRGRKGHYAKESLVASQFATLEPPREALVVDGEEPAAQVAEEVEAALAGKR